MALHLSACGGHTTPPPRGVIEGDVGGFSFRRYQEVLDIEVWVPKNPAVAHTASYARTSALRRSRVLDQDVVNSVVTRYQSERGVMRALAIFCRRLAQESGYVVEDSRLGGAHVITVRGHSEAWALWASGRHVVKIGGRDLRQVPAAIIAGYAERYPSQLVAGLLEGPLPAGESESIDDDPDYDPAHPTPEWRDRPGSN